MAEQSQAELQKQLEKLQRQMAQLQGKVQGSKFDPTGKNLAGISNPIETKGMHRMLIHQLRSTHFIADGGEKEGTRITAKVKVMRGANPVSVDQTAVLKDGKWLLAEDSKTVAELLTDEGPTKE